MHLPNLAGNFSKRALSNTTPLNYKNSEILHFCNRNDNDHRKKFDNPYCCLRDSQMRTVIIEVHDVGLQKINATY